MAALRRHRLRRSPPSSYSTRFRSGIQQSPAVCPYRRNDFETRAQASLCGLRCEGEGCLIYATISSQDGRFEVGFDQTGQTVFDLRSTDDRVRDRLGNEVRSPLRNGLAAEAATCDAGESITCASPLIKGLSYIVIEDDRCSVSVKDQSPTRIPLVLASADFRSFRMRIGTNMATMGKCHNSHHASRLCDHADRCIVRPSSSLQLGLQGPKTNISAEGR